MSGVPIGRPSPVHRVLACPELFRLICGILGKKAVKLICLSRTMFPVAALAIWEDVDVQDLLALIPGTKRTNKTRNRKLYSIRVFDLPSTEINLERFELYAPFVRRLYTGVPCAVNFPLHWMQPKRGIVTAPLLPNLLHLEIYHRASFRREELEWSSMFIGPRLLRFETHVTSFERRPRAEEEIFIELVTKMSEICSRLETLSVPCRKDLSLPVLGLHNLRIFSINECAISDELLHALSRLPYLEELSVSQGTLGQPRTTCKEPIKLSDNPFPSLRCLVLNHISPFLIARFCTSTKRFHKLVDASIFFGFDDNNVSTDSVQRLTFAILSLGRNSPRITNLAISQLSPIGWHDFLAAVPLLEEFKLSAQTFNLSELLVFATMLPHLRLLEFDGIECIGTEEVPPTIGWHPANQSVTIRVGIVKIGASTGSSTLNVARYFHHLWPSVTFEGGRWSGKVAAELNRVVASLRTEEF